jgi:hypothetical protein
MLELIWTVLLNVINWNRLSICFLSKMAPNNFDNHDAKLSSKIHDKITRVIAVYNSEYSVVLRIIIFFFFNIDNIKCS